MWRKETFRICEAKQKRSKALEAISIFVLGCHIPVKILIVYFFSNKRFTRQFPINPMPINPKGFKFGTKKYRECVINKGKLQ